MVCPSPSFISAAGWRDIMASAPSPDEDFARDVEAARKEVRQFEKLRDKRDAILNAARKRGVTNVRVFGSVVRGEAEPGSDIDLLVDLEAGRTLLDLSAFQREVTELLNLSLDVATPDMLKPRIRDTVLEEALAL
jgi:uncharacterized protein